jgi:hypothetical protein
LYPVGHFGLVPLTFFVVLPFLHVIVLVDGALATTYLMSAIFSFTPLRLENGFGMPNFGQQLQADILFVWT